jgi:Spy/CpxP family protein refolding chaperone
MDLMSDPVNTGLRRTWPTAVTVFVVVVAVWIPCAFGQGWAWWNDPRAQRELALSDEQVRALDRLFREDLAGRRAVRAALETAQRDFDHALEVADEAAALALIPRIARLTTEQNRARTILLLRMSWVLTTAQQTRLDALRRQRSSGDRR